LAECYELSVDGEIKDGLSSYLRYGFRQIMMREPMFLVELSSGIPPQVGLNLSALMWKGNLDVKKERFRFKV
jgi:hypothetical protein